MPSEDKNDQLSIEDLLHPHEIFFDCGRGGTIVAPPDIAFNVPPPGSPFEGRLLLATANAGSSVNVDIPPPPAHIVTFSTVVGGTDRQALVRIPVGVQVFQVIAAGGQAFYYEAAADHDILPHFIPFDPAHPEPGQTMQEVVLIVSPNPPRDATKATSALNFTLLSKTEVNTRRAQVGLPPLP